MRIPVATNRRRAGTFFTMIIFIMMLISTALMYYYFQRTRVLERDLAAIRRGELDPNDAGGNSGYLSWAQPAGTASESQNAAAVPKTDVALHPKTQPKAPSADNPNGLVLDQRAAANPTTATTRLTDLNRTDGSPDASEASNPATDQAGNTAVAQQGSDSQTPQQTRDADTAQPTTENALNGEQAVGQVPLSAAVSGSDGEAQPPQAEATQASEPQPAAGGDSLYNMAPQPVKVRAPRRR